MPLKIYTDNSACTYILKKPKLAPWAVQLVEYNYEVAHKKGMLNKAADALSRIEIATISSTIKEEDEMERTRAE